MEARRDEDRTMTNRKPLDRFKRKLSKHN